MGKYEVFKDKGKQWRFNLKAGNGEIIAVSEGYSSEQACLNGIESVKRNANSEVVFTYLVEEKAFNDFKEKVVSPEEEKALIGEVEEKLVDENSGIFYKGKKVE